MKKVRNSLTWFSQEGSQGSNVLFVVQATAYPALQGEATPFPLLWSEIPLTYETTGEVGQPIWKDIFRHILKECSYLTAFSTVYVMVDTRNLMAHGTAQGGLPHWPAAVAWWHSGVQLTGPHQK